jgi:two-component system sensor histidine kinase BaeS
MTIEPTTLETVVDRVVSALAASAGDREVRLTTEYDDDTPPVLADPQRLEQSLLKLVANAIKFTASGGSVTVRVGVDEELAAVSVVDTGAGIDRADFDKVFERFFRTRSAVDDAVPGSGLGLAIARTMIEAQSGTIGVESVVGSGSTFTVRLPTADPAPAEAS